MTTINDYLDAEYVGDAVRRDLEDDVVEAERAASSYEAMLDYLRPVMENNSTITVEEAVDILHDQGRDEPAWARNLRQGPGETPTTPNSARTTEPPRRPARDRLRELVGREAWKLRGDDGAMLRDR